MAAPARAWCFTINNPSFPTSDLPRPDAARYIVWQRERGEQGTVHLQGYVELTKPQRMAALKSTWSTAHLEPRRGTREQARDYCMKADTRDDGDDAGPFEFGSFAAGGSGARNDVRAVLEALKEGKSKREIYEEFPEVSAKFPRFVDQGLNYQRLDRLKKVELSNPRPFQKQIIDMIAEDPHPRQVLWIYDRAGGAGKTHLAKYLCREKGAFYTNGGKHADIGYAYQGEQICIFDYVRDSESYVNYGIIEAIKNGILFSPKYESGVKQFDTPHVIIFANFMPDKSKMSEDRWVIVKLKASGDYELQS